MIVDNKEYNMTLYEALEIVINGEGWVQGSEFGSGVVLRRRDDAVYAYDFQSTNEWTPQITTGLRSQKFRRVYTQAGSKK